MMFQFVQTKWNWIGILLGFTAGAMVIWAICRSVEHLAEIEFLNAKLPPQDQTLF